MKKLIILATIVVLGGCAGANISSQVRESGEAGSNKMVRCVVFATGNADEINAQIQRYDGWKMVYTSEYTTPNKTDTAAVMCFEKPYTK